MPLFFSRKSPARPPHPVPASVPAFQFHDPGPLVDDDLELIPPDAPWVDAVLAACNHPQTLKDAPVLRDTSRVQLLDFLRNCPGGRAPADPAHGIVPGYHFWMRSHRAGELPIVGGIGLRVANAYEIVMYFGHVGYHVYPFARGRHYAQRACRLLLPLARHHAVNPIWITCNPDNYPSRHTCESLGATLVEIVQVPTHHTLYARGEREKCRYRLDL